MLAVLTAVIIGTDGILDIVRQRRHAKSVEEKKAIEWYLLGALRTLGKNIDIDPVYLGASIFEVRKSRSLERKGVKFYRRLRLVHYVRYRLDAFPPPSGIKWGPGCGAIGRALEKRATVHCDWVATSTLLSDQPNAPLPDGTDLWGLGENEFRFMARHYYESLATPILSPTSGRLLGILAIDLPNHDALTQDSAVLGAKDMEQSLAVPTARTIALHWKAS